VIDDTCPNEKGPMTITRNSPMKCHFSWSIEGSLT
jgi:hypothetical protein